SSRIEPLAPEMRKTGILFTQTVMGPTGEAAVVVFNDAVDKLQDFTTSADLIENTITQLKLGTSGSKLYDAMAVGVEMLSSRPQATAEKPGRRRVLLILSEAIDDGSEKQLGEVLPRPPAARTWPRSKIALSKRTSTKSAASCIRNTPSATPLRAPMRPATTKSKCL